MSEDQIRDLVDGLFRKPVSITVENSFLSGPADVSPNLDEEVDAEVEPLPTAEDLGELESRTYDLSVEAAGKLKIPVIGDVGGGGSRRVVVYEWTRFTNRDTPDGGVDRWGYTIRFCVTVSKLNSSSTITLPFLAAEAQLGRIEASWTMQVRGLRGPQIDAAVLPPESLDVETFVMARKSMQEIVAAVSDEHTSIHPVLLFHTPPLGEADSYEKSALTTFVLAALAKGKRSDWVLSRMRDTNSARELVAQVYSHFGAELGGSPSRDSRRKAEGALQGVQVSLR